MKIAEMVEIVKRNLCRNYNAASEAESSNRRDLKQIFAISRLSVERDDALSLCS